MPMESSRGDDLQQSVSRTPFSKILYLPQTTLYEEQ